MARIPPLLPEEVLSRVLRIARFDGIGILAVSGLFAVLSASAGDRTGAIVGLLVAGAGAIEMHGVTLLQYGAQRGMSWLIWSQLYLMLTILGYCQFRLMNVDVALLRTAITDDMKTQLAAAGWTVDEFVRFAYRLSWMTIAVVTVLYQGAMALYYVRRRKPIAQALEEESAE